MNDAISGRTYQSLRRLAKATHSVPLFEGRRSRRHHDVALWQLWAQARAHRLANRGRFAGLAAFAQFAGFPRSGHSLIGSIIDAHPRARVAHELDAMGLLKKGFSQADILALVDKKSAEFTRHGRFWNGFCYLVPGGAHGQAANLRVIGDKKGDMAVRWIARDPGLLDRLQEGGPSVKKWILILRNPFDNIATMSLRKGRAYDVLRTTTPQGEDFRRALIQQQGRGAIADEALDSQIDDYAALCQTVAMMKQKTPVADWLELCYEDFALDPVAGINTLCAFLGLTPADDYVNNCAALVNKRVHKSRGLIRWPAAKRARVASLLGEFSFLNRYRGDDDGR